MLKFLYLDLLQFDAWEKKDTVRFMFLLWPLFIFWIVDSHLFQFLRKGNCYFKDSVVTWNCLATVLGKSSKNLPKWWLDGDESHGSKKSPSTNS